MNTTKNKPNLAAKPPDQMKDWYESLPDKYCGKFYATIKHPYLPIKREYLVPVWGQICDGGNHKSAVQVFLHNELPNRGRGYKYVSWRSEPDRPDINDAPRMGIITIPAAL